MTTSLRTALESPSARAPRLADYEKIAPAGSVHLIRHLARDLAGKTFLHVNSTREGGGVAEILHRMLPLMEDVGVRTRWEVIAGPPEYYVATKRIHNTLQGADLAFTRSMQEAYLETARRTLAQMDLAADLVMIHDPQPAPLIEGRPPGSHWIWRCHIDLSRPQRSRGGASDDPEGAEVLARVREEAAGDPDVHILLLPSDAHLDINALQRAATVVIQKSTKEGFGLTVAEALWKGKPVVGGAVGGIAKQIQDGVTGFLVHSVEGCAYALRRLLSDPAARQRMGSLAREHARRNLLITRHLSDYLQMLRLHAT